MPADQLAGHGPWWQVYVEFTNWAASELTFVRHVEPLLRAARDDGPVGAWWFMRKHPCWRLRLRPRQDPQVMRETIGAAFDGLVDDGAVRRWRPGVYEPEEAAFGGPEGTAAAHNLFATDSSAIMELLNRDRDGADLGRRELSVVLCTALLRGAGLEWYEQGDAWHRVALERPFPRDVTDGQVRGLADSIKTLLSADTSPGSGLFRPSAPLAEFAEWAAAFRQAGRELGALTRSGALRRGLREILSYHVIFHWNRLGLTARQQAILARAARDAILGPIPPTAVRRAFPEQPGWAAPHGHLIVSPHGASAARARDEIFAKGSRLSSTIDERIRETRLPMTKQQELQRSYRELPPDAARMFRALGLHPGPDISLEAAAAAVGVPARAARRTLDILLGAFLVESVRPHRYQLHDLLRAYALDQARTVDSEDQRLGTLDRMLRWYITAASRTCSALATRSVAVDVPSPDGPEPPAFENAAAAFEWFDTERPNLVAAARAALDAGLDRRAWELAIVLSPIHASYHTFDDWSALSGVAVTAAERIADARMQADALVNRGKFLFRRRALEEARAVHTRALAIREEIGDPRGILQSLNALGLIGLRTRQLTEASAYFADVAERARREGDRYWDGMGRMNQAEAHLEAGNAALGLQIVGPLPEFFADLRDPGSEGNSLWLLSWAHRLSGNLPDALAAIDAALRIAEDSSNRVQEAWWLVEAARVHLALGDTGEAMRCCRMAASLERQIGDHSREATALDLTGEVLAAMGRADDAAAFHREAARMHRQLGDQWQEALATVHLAECEQALGHSDASRDHLAAALALLQQFPDERAAELRADIQIRLA